MPRFYCWISIYLASKILTENVPLYTLHPRISRFKVDAPFLIEVLHLFITYAVCLCLKCHITAYIHKKYSMCHTFKNMFKTFKMLFKDVYMDIYSYFKSIFVTAKLYFAFMVFIF